MAHWVCGSGFNDAANLICGTTVLDRWNTRWLSSIIGANMRITPWSPVAGICMCCDGGICATPRVACNLIAFLCALVNWFLLDMFYFSNLSQRVVARIIEKKFN
jgi:hypothetical protein